MNAIRRWWSAPEHRAGVAWCWFALVVAFACELAVFSCLEALQNVAKYAEASRATIALSNGDGSLRFVVTDDGAGFDSSATSYGTGLQGIADRLAALDGTLEVRSQRGGGTTLIGRVPIGEAP